MLLVKNKEGHAIVLIEPFLNDWGGKVSHIPDGILSFNNLEAACEDVLRVTEPCQFLLTSSFMSLGRLNRPVALSGIKH